MSDKNKKPIEPFKVKSLDDYKATRNVLSSGQHLSMGQQHQAAMAMLDFIDEYRD